MMIGILCPTLDSAKGGGGGRSRGPRGRGRVFTGRMPILIPNRNPASMGYYENKDVSFKPIFSFSLQRF